jgi:hypothetical protein
MPGCKEKFGEKKPFEDKSKTHGICDKCLASERKRIKKTGLLSSPANRD